MSGYHGHLPELFVAYWFALLIGALTLGAVPCPSARSFYGASMAIPGPKIGRSICVAAIGVRLLLSDGGIVAVGFQRACKVVLRLLCVANPVIRQAEQADGNRPRGPRTDGEPGTINIADRRWAVRVGEALLYFVFK